MNTKLSDNAPVSSVPNASLPLNERYDLQDVVDLAKKEGFFYFSCRGDTAWKRLRNSEENGLGELLVSADLELSLPKIMLDLRKCEILGTEFTLTRNLKCDSRHAISSKNIGIWLENDSSNEELRKKTYANFAKNCSTHTPEAHRTIEDCKSKSYHCDIKNYQDGVYGFIVNDIRARGVIVISEMQKNENLILWQNDQDANGKSNVDDMPVRLEDYSYWAACEDRGLPTGTIDCVRRGKNPGDEVSRSIIAIAYRGYGSFGEVRKNASTLTQPFMETSSARGHVIATVDLGKIRSRDDFWTEKLLEEKTNEVLNKISQELSGSEKKKQANKIRRNLKNDRGFQAKVEKLSQEKYEIFLAEEVSELRKKLSAYSKAVQEILIIYAMSNLLTPNIVKEFEQSTQRICKFLEVNVNNIKNELSPAEANALIGRFKSVDEAEARADKAEANNKAILDAMDPETRRNIRRKLGASIVPYTGSSAEPSPEKKLKARQSKKAEGPNSNKQPNVPKAFKKGK